ncbi:hypothetical protein D3OALGA1CA_3768 [Olavius algarvensis associated proteobacterium Delta 3]|nr:hypothetical protein D3OALGA1CA_3768 [Olavius algarvensis associated proteobacterium Delta 3]
MRTLRNTILAIAALALIGLGVNAFAHGGWGGGGGHYGPGMHHYGAYDRGYDDRMSAEDYKAFEQKREAFLKETQDLRASLFDKERELQNELAKDEPDVTKASRLQKEVSKLESKLDQKRINHMVEMRKLNPNAGRGNYRGGAMMGGGPMMGYGSYGGGPSCWR